MATGRYHVPLKLGALLNAGSIAKIDNFVDHIEATNRKNLLSKSAR